VGTRENHDETLTYDVVVEPMLKVAAISLSFSRALRLLPQKSRIDSVMQTPVVDLAQTLV
jgi:hypothetical protein